MQVLNLKNSSNRLILGILYLWLRRGRPERLPSHASLRSSVWKAFSVGSYLDANGHIYNDGIAGRWCSVGHAYRRVWG